MKRCSTSFTVTDRSRGSGIDVGGRGRGCGASARWINSARGVWAITEAGQQIGSADETMELARRRQKGYQSGLQGPGARAEDSDDPDEASGGDSWQAALVEVLHKMEPAAFERLCQRLLREYGFARVELTGRSAIW